jgi:IS30 family transposase
MLGNISLEERIKIQTLNDKGCKVVEIANYIGRHKSSIYRELSKTGTDGQYDYRYAQELTSLNMIRNLNQGPATETIDIIENKILTEQWSPEQISGWLNLHHNIAISHTWIYSHIDSDRKAGGELSNHLRHGKYTSEPKEYKGKIPDRVSIEKRPEIINERSRLGDFEIDLIVGPKNRGAILSIIDRLSRYCILHKLSGKTASEIEASVIKALDDYNGEKHSITSDNGTEFTNHTAISKSLNIDYYFAHPYASYERGSIENLNGLIRQYIPKGTHFSDIEDGFVKNIEGKLNNRPRKVLGFMTPIEYNEVKSMC